MTEQELNKACEWLEMQVEYYVFDDGEMEVQHMLEDFRKAMEAVIKDSLNPVQNDAEAVIKVNLTTELTWQDVQRIVKIADYIVTHEIGRYADEEAYYSEILRRFKEESK